MRITMVAILALGCGDSKMSPAHERELADMANRAKVDVESMHAAEGRRTIDRSIQNARVGAASDRTAAPAPAPETREPIQHDNATWEQIARDAFTPRPGDLFYPGRVTAAMDIEARTDGLTMIMFATVRCSERVLAAWINRRGDEARALGFTRVNCIREETDTAEAVVAESAL